jgi:1-acyl-sn-glycerol-3-phosphate acyltransferase
MAKEMENSRISTWLWLKVVTASLLLRHRSFSTDASSAVSGSRIKLRILGSHNVPANGPCLVTCNHYTRPGLAAWWGALLISTVVSSHRDNSAQPDIHWVMTAAWTFPDKPWQRQYLSPLTRWAFKRVARIYGFITMPPMPPTPEEVYARADAVRQTLRLARQIAPEGGMIGLAPEGRDTPGVVGAVPEGVGDFIALLCSAGLPVLPVAVFESDGHLCAHFGPEFFPKIPPKKTERDYAVAQQVMDAIQALVVVDTSGGKNG